METEIPRTYRIGATDAAVILGVGFKTPFDLWLDKRREIEPTELNEAARWGILQENTIGARYAEETGREYKRPRRCRKCGAGWFQFSREIGTNEMCGDCGSELIGERSMFHKEHSWAIARPDGLIHGDEDRGVDFKNVSWHASMYWGDPGSEDVPAGYFVQAQWCSMVTGRSMWDLAALKGGNDFAIYPVEARPEFQQGMFNVCRDFLERNLIGGERPAFDHGESVDRWLKKVHPKNTAALRDATPEEMGIADELREFILKADSIEKTIEARKNALKAAIGDADGIRFGGSKITWKKNQDGEKVDWEAVANSLAEEVAPEKFRDLIAAMTTPKIGPRVFLTPRDWKAELKTARPKF